MSQYSYPGEFLLAKRKEQGMTLQQMSNKVGRIIGFIADVEKHRAYAPEINTLGRWAEVLGMLPHERNLLN